MAKPPLERNEALATDVVGMLFDRAYELQEEREDLQRRNAAVRESLRNLEASGVLTEDQVRDLNEIYPRRRSNGATEQE